VERRVELVIDPLRRETVTVSLPLRLRRPVEDSLRTLGISPAVDLSDPIVAKAVALADAARARDPAFRFAVFGGTAYRLTCPISNDPRSGLRHELHDLDLAVRLKDIRELRRFLGSVAAEAGSALTFFETAGDRIFNSLSGGRRLRWHMTVAERESGVVLGTLDLVADSFEFCHRIDVREDVEHAPEHAWTLGLAHLLLTKGQFIQRIPLDAASAVSDRVLEPFGKRAVVIGPEPKDVRDILALLHDHGLGEGHDEISLRELSGRLEEDWGLWKTFGLNLAMIARSPVLAGLPSELRARILPRLTELQRVVASCSPRRRLGFLGGPWWQEVDSTPPVDATVPVRPA
jgi:hypothetical protein